MDKDNKKKETEKTPDESTQANTSAAETDAIITSPTEAARSNMSGGNFGNTGTNVSYETPAVGGAGGSAGTGYSDNQTGAAPAANSSSDAEQSAILRSKDNNEDTIGNP